MPNIETAVLHACAVAQNDHYGYSQPRRDTEQDEDCSTLVLNSLREAGVDVGSATYTGNMLQPLLNAGFQNVVSSVNMRTGIGLKRGDILLRPKTAVRGGHTAIYIGEGKIVQAQSDYDRRPGDSSGREIRIQSYYDSPFTYVLRYPEAPTLFSVRLKQDMNIRSGPGTRYSKLYVADRGSVLDIAEVSGDGRWGRIQGSAWVCITSTYVSRI